MSDYEILRTVARQAPLSMGFSRQGYWSGLPFPPPRDLPHPGIKSCLSGLLHWQADSISLKPPGKPCVAQWLRNTLESGSLSPGSVTYLLKDLVKII